MNDSTTLIKKDIELLQKMIESDTLVHFHPSIAHRIVNTYKNVQQLQKEIQDLKLEVKDLKDELKEAYGYINCLENDISYLENHSNIC